MAGGQAGRRSASQSGFGNWLANAGSNIDQARRAAEAKGRELYEKALRDGQPILARTQAEITALGAKYLQAQANAIRQDIAVGKGIVTVIKDPHSVDAQRFIQDSKNQTKAFAHGAGDAVSFGLADAGSSGIRALAQSKWDLSKVGENYHRDMEQERAQDAYEAEHYGEARLGGQITGTVASMVIPGGVATKVGGGLLRTAVPLARGMVEALPTIRTLGVPAVERMAEATPLILRERAAAAGASGLSGAGTQVLSDSAEGRKTTVGDLAAATLGGVAQGFGAPYLGHVGTGALGGGVTAGLRDPLNGRDFSIADTATGGLIGAGAGGFAGMKAGAWADGLSSKEKGVLGEEMSILRSHMRGMPPSDTNNRAPILMPKPARPGARQDHAIGPGQPVEAKFGRRPRLSAGQRRAYQLGLYARVDHFTPQDVATTVSIPISQLSSDVIDAAADYGRAESPKGWGLTTLLPYPSD